MSGSPTQTHRMPGEAGKPLAPPVTAQGIEARAALLSAARELFTARGYAGVETEELERRAGATSGALQRHFTAGKQELFRELLVQISAEAAQAVARAALAQEDPWEALGAGVDAFLDACVRPEVRRIVLLDGPSVLDWDLWRAMQSNDLLRLVKDTLQRAIDAGRLTPAPAEPLTQVLLGALHEAAMVIAQADDPLIARAEMRATVRRLLAGLRGPVI